MASLAAVPEPADVPGEAVVMRVGPFKPEDMLRQAAKGRIIMLEDPNIPNESAVDCLSVWVAVQAPGETVEDTCARLVAAAQLAGLVSDQSPKVRACTYAEAREKGWYLFKEGYVDEPAEHYCLAPSGNVVDAGAVDRLADVMMPRTWT